MVVVERTGAIPIEPFRPLTRAEPVSRGGTEDSRRSDAGREEVRVDAFRAGPGAVPFADYLHALNLEASIRGRVPREPVRPPSAMPPPEASPTGRRDESLPRLGDVSPVRPEPPAPAPRPIDVYRRPLGSGRLIDVVV